MGAALLVMGLGALLALPMFRRPAGPVYQSRWWRRHWFGWRRDGLTGRLRSPRYRPTVGLRIDGVWHDYARPLPPSGRAQGPRDA